MSNELIVAITYFSQQVRAAWRTARAIAAGRITLEEIEDDTIGRCESCSKVFQLDNALMSEDGCYFCPECVVRWNEEAA